MHLFKCEAETSCCCTDRHDEMIEIVSNPVGSRNGSYRCDLPEVEDWGADTSESKSRLRGVRSKNELCYKWRPESVDNDGGEWEQNIAQGCGKYVHIDGVTYEGDFFGAEKRSGQGVETWTDGAMYTGEFQHGTKHGHGQYRSGGGVTFTGQFQNNEMDGEGMYEFSDGQLYTGQWERGHMSGSGRMEWPNGSVYDGGYERDMKNGHGIFTWRDGQVYEGQWVDGKQEGSGVTRDVLGHATRGIWAKGERVENSHSLPLPPPLQGLPR